MQPSVPAAEPHHHWRRLSLIQQFAAASLAVLLAGMLIIGWWVNREIENGVVQNTAATTAVYMNSVIAPALAELEDHDAISEENIATLRYLLDETPLRNSIISLKVWGPGGRVLYSNLPGATGRVFAVTGDLEAAWGGAVAAEISDVGDEEDVLERARQDQLLEIYSPIRNAGGSRVIAVAEFYADASGLEQRLLQARLYSWLLVGAVTLSMFALLFGIVRGGSRTIARQRAALESQLDDLSTLLKQNARLSQRARSANHRALEINERFLRRVSAELHDGAAQALGFALLRLDAVLRAESGSAAGDRDDVEAIRGALDEALREIRNLSSGLAMPDIESMTLGEALQRLVRIHERRTATRVRLEDKAGTCEPPLAARIALYRFAQEALNNATRHGGAIGMVLRLDHQGDTIRAQVSDDGPGFDPVRALADTDRLGLAGMRERIEGLGGRFELDSAPGHGTRVSATLPLAPEEERDER